MWTSKKKTRNELLNEVSIEYLKKIKESNGTSSEAFVLSRYSRIIKIKRIDKDEYKILIWDEARRSYYLVIGKLVDHEFKQMLNGFVPDFILN